MKTSWNLGNYIIPAAAFFLLYLTIHLCLDRHLNDYSFAREIVTSLVCGAVLGIANAFLSAKRENWRFGRELLVFWVLYAVVQVVSYILIMAYFRSDLSHDSLLWLVCYWFPQTVIVAFMVPGAVLYHLISGAAYWRAKRAA